MSAPALTRREALWFACAAKSCCHTSVIIPTGRDVWRIARALDAPPMSFLVYFETEDPRRDAFALDATDRRYRLALAKRPPRTRRATPPCVFLLRTRQGQHRCSLGELRPLVCKTFPCTMSSDMLAVADGGMCSCRHWSMGDVNVDEELPLVRERQAAAAEYCAIVADWNARLATAPPSAPVPFTEYCEFLLTLYDAKRPDVVGVRLEPRAAAAAAPA